jgi:hypothetical protein
MTGIQTDRHQTEALHRNPLRAQKHLFEFCVIHPCLRPGEGLKTCATQRRSAGLEPAVSPNCIRQRVRKLARPPRFASLAECNSAIRQIQNLRYGV